MTPMVRVFITLSLSGGSASLAPVSGGTRSTLSCPLQQSFLRRGRCVVRFLDVIR